MLSILNWLNSCTWQPSLCNFSNLPAQNQDTILEFEKLFWAIFPTPHCPCDPIPTHQCVYEPNHNPDLIPTWPSLNLNPACAPLLNPIPTTESRPASRGSIPNLVSETPMAIRILEIVNLGILDTDSQKFRQKYLFPAVATWVREARIAKIAWN